MIAIQISISAILLGGLLLTALFVGYAFRSLQMRKLMNRIGELEKEMLANHAEILDLQQEKVVQLQRLRELTIPVIPMNIAGDESKSDKLMPDVTIRKKLLASKPIEKR